MLADGDVISIDCGAIVDGWHGDAAITVAIGEVDAEVTELMRVTEESMWRGFAAARLGGHVSDISHAVESYVRSQEREGGRTTGSSRTTPGTGSAPDAPAAQRAELRPPGAGAEAGARARPRGRADGHPGQKHTVVAEDDWTILTEDGSWAAHFEHTFTLTPDGPWVLTALDGGRARLAELGLPYGGSD